MSNPERHPRQSRTAALSRGAMLIDLLVGLSVGSIVLGAAIASMLVGRDVASSVSEMSLLQQQSSHALRALGLQIRPAGSMELQAGPGGRFRLVPAPAEPGAPATLVIQGRDGTRGGSDSMQAARTSSPLLSSQQDDCLGQNITPGERLEARFDVDGKGALRCRGGAQPQPLVAGVAAFRLRYRVRQGDQLRDLRATEIDAANLWPAVVAVEVCLDLRGEERSSAYVGRYTDCSGQQASSDGRLHMVTRKLFQVHTQAGG